MAPQLAGYLGKMCWKVVSITPGLHASMKKSSFRYSNLTVTECVNGKQVDAICQDSFNEKQVKREPEIKPHQAEIRGPLQAQQSFHAHPRDVSVDVHHGQGILADLCPCERHTRDIRICCERAEPTFASMPGLSMLLYINR